MWIAGCAAGLAKFPRLPGLEAITLWTDHDASGTGERAATECGGRLSGQGVEVRSYRAPALGSDWNDWLRAHA